VSSLDEALFLLEKTFDKFFSYMENLSSEKEFLIQEVERKDEDFHTFLNYREITLEKLNNIRKVLTEEIKLDVLPPQRHKQESPINIYMVEDE
jgi:hypothetical protein